MKSAIFAALLLLAACGRVTDPLPPIIRIPQNIDTLSASQSGYKVVLTWRNPSTYIDGNPATDTGVVHVFRNTEEIGTVAAGAAGQPQSFPVDVSNNVGTPLTFSIQLVVAKAKKNAVSNVVPIQPVDVPGIPGILVPTVDQGKIVLVWDPPERRADLVEAYVVQRSDKPAPSVERTPRFVDSDIEAGKTYTYSVTAVRGTSPQIAGDGSRPLTVVATDKIKPATPTGLEIEVLMDVVFLKWEKNTESDLKGYQLYRSDRSEPIFTGIPNGYPDLDYVPGRGLTYRILAEDISGNKSEPSAPKPGP